MATPSEIEMVWRMLRASYPSFAREQGPEEMANTLSVYEQMLADMPFEILKTAAIKHAASSKFFPTMAELRQAAATVTQEPVPTALEAWGRITDCFNSSKYYRYEDHSVTPEFPDDPILEAVLHDLGGYWYLAQETTNIVADRKQFIDAYNQRQERAAGERNLLPQVREARERIQTEQRERIAGLLTSTGQILRRVK
jgi:hypothetical protein